MKMHSYYTHLSGWGFNFKACFSVNKVTEGFAPCRDAAAVQHFSVMAHLQGHRRYPVSGYKADSQADSQCREISKTGTAISLQTSNISAT